MFNQEIQHVNVSHHLETILDEVNIGTWAWDLKTDDVTWSENMSGILGLATTSGEIKTTRSQCISSIHYDDVDFVEKEINRSLKEKKNLKIEYRVIWPDDSIHWVQSRGVVINSGGNGPSHILGIMFDITERKVMESILKETQDLAARQNQAKSDFLSSMSHELKTPLNAILGFTNILLKEENIIDEQKQSLNIIRRSGEHLNSLVDEVLNLSSIEAGKIELNMENVQLKNLLIESVDLINVTINEQGQNLLFDIGECDNEYINTDKKRFTQIMLNILSNAVKYNRAGGEIQLYSKKTDNKIYICVKDHGLGLSPEQQEKLFQPFQRLGAERTSIQGTGMGLVITKQLIELMGGNISVESKLGLGCTFCLEYPRAS